MSLQGSLKDMGIIDLIQFPHQGRKTGKLTVTREGKLLATLYYDQGNLVSGRSERASGIDVIVDLVDLKDGEFLFDNTESPGEVNIEMDLHHAILQALKLRDERKNEQKQTVSTDAVLPSRAAEILSAMLQRASWMQYACILGRDAEVETEQFGQRGDGRNSEQFEPLRSSIIGFLRSYPADGVGKLLIDQADGFVMVQALASGHLLMVVCGHDAVMGALVAAVAKTANALQEELMGEKS